MSDHTPTPWIKMKTMGDKTGLKLPRRTIIMQADERGHPILEPPLADLGFCTPTSEANAAYIVEAANAHSRLTAEVARLRRDLEKIAEMATNDSGVGLSHEVLDWIARYAHESLEGRTP